MTLLFAVAALQPAPEPDGEEANRAAEAALRVHAHPTPPGRVCVLVLSLRFFFPTGRDSHTRTQMKLDAELAPLRVSALQLRARQEGCAEPDIEEAMDGDTPRPALKALITTAGECNKCSSPQTWVEN